MPKTPAKPAAPVQGRAATSASAWAATNATARAATSPAKWRAVLGSKAAGAALILAAVAAYFNTFDAPFVFDDLPTIVENRAVRHLWPIGDVLLARHLGGQTASGRPLVNLSLAINYALGGEAVWGYHAFNLLIHVLAGLTLFGIVRRTLQQPVLEGRFGAAALPLGLAVAAIWTLHPLQTESVTYIVQRAESLMGLCYLLTLYGFIRGVQSVDNTGGLSPSSGHSSPEIAAGNERRPKAGVEWFALSFSACLLGMASKEVMVSAPLMVFLYDRTFVAGTFREAWRLRWRFHLGLAATWLLLVYLVAGTASRGGTVGFGTKVSSWSYALTQCRAVPHYLWLSVWPRPLVFDYGTTTVESLAEVWPQALGLIALVVATAVALWRRPVWGFLGVWFFAILAPSSSFVPVVSQTMAEHRMYLSLAAVIVLVVMGLHVWLDRRSLLVPLRVSETSSTRVLEVSLCRSNWLVCAALAAVCGGLTYHRNQDYRSVLGLWSDTIAKQPDNQRAHISLGILYAKKEQWPEAVAHYNEALRLQPDYADAHNGLGTALMTAGRTTEGIAHFEEALRSTPEFAIAERNLGLALVTIGRTAEAIPHFEKAVQLKPDYAEAELFWGIALSVTNHFSEAVPHFEKAIELEPDLVDAHNSYGGALVHAGRLDEAVRQYAEVLRLKPDRADAHLNLALALRQLGREQEAAEHYREALRLNPDLAAGKQR